jgi:hypothetical protein
MCSLPSIFHWTSAMVFFKFICQNCLSCCLCCIYAIPLHTCVRFWYLPLMGFCSVFYSTQTEKPRAPSYFSAYFKCQLAEAERHKANGDESHGVKTLYIDRDPVTFADISRHLQGYHIQPRDGAHFVKLFADAQFYQRKPLCHSDTFYILKPLQYRG